MSHGAPMNEPRASVLVCVLCFGTGLCDSAYSTRCMVRIQILMWPRFRLVGPLSKLEIVSVCWFVCLSVGLYTRTHALQHTLEHVLTPWHTHTRCRVRCRAHFQGLCQTCTYFLCMLPARPGQCVRSRCHVHVWDTHTHRYRLEHTHTCRLQRCACFKIEMSTHLEHSDGTRYQWYMFVVHYTYINTRIYIYIYMYLYIQVWYLTLLFITIWHEALCIRCIASSPVRNPLLSPVVLMLYGYNIYVYTCLHVNTCV